MGIKNNCKQDFNVGGHVSEEVRIFKYLVALIMWKIEISEEVKMRITPGSVCYSIQLRAESYYELKSEILGVM